MFSKTCEYGLRACVFIATGSEKGNKVGIQEIAKEIDSPVYFTGKILQQLVKARIVRSVKGPNGGFFLDPEAKPVPVLRVLEVLGCDNFFYSCALGLKSCSDKHPCPMHDAFKPYREGLKQLLAGTTIQELGRQIKAGNGHILDPPEKPTPTVVAVPRDGDNEPSASM